MAQTMPVRIPANVAAAILGVTVSRAYEMIEAGLILAERIPGRSGVTVAVSDLESQIGRVITPADLCQALAVAERRADHARELRHRGNRLGAVHARERAEKLSLRHVLAPAT